MSEPERLRPPVPAELPAIPLERRRILLLAGLGGLTVLLLLSLGGGREALRALLGADWRLMALAVLIHYAGFALRGLRWQGLLAALGHRLSAGFLTALLLAGWFVSALLPARAGDLLRIGVLRLGDDDRPAVPAAVGLGSIVLERALDLLAILVLGAVFGFAALRGQVPGPVLAAYAAGIVLLAGMGLAVLLAPPLLTRLRDLFTWRVWRLGLTFVEQTFVSLRLLAAQPAAALVAGGESLAIWLCDAVVFWLVVHSIGEPLAFSLAAFVALTVDVAAAVPLTPGGIGQIESAYAALLAAVGIGQTAAVVLGVRLVTYWSFLLFSGVVTFAAGFGALLGGRPAQPPAESVDRAPS